MTEVKPGQVWVRKTDGREVVIQGGTGRDVLVASREGVGRFWVTVEGLHRKYTLEVPDDHE
jgi:hypothetical protein